MRFKFAKYSLALLFLLSSFNVFAQRKEISTWSAQISLGLNSPSKGGFVDGFSAQTLNLPTVNLGVQRMFSRTLGAKLDYGFNRFKSESDNPEFKVNYSRINAQLVYNPSESLNFLPQPMQLVAHAGPGFSMVKPLGTLDENKQSYLNFNLGFEVHYSINRKVNLFTDISYIYGFTSLDDYNPEINGLGAFNGSVFNVSFGVSIALSGCYYCE
ncbi:outer membrane beta-barrel protein [Winogradskyella jejuensis]|uniref:Outer membrane protein beta-barrel domain-containing protein n=1 Tax=Winogradskyella jejuensis TaxID=1089305 RepID=A0A1M5P826_9FLAO|nr:outer membrane beta-barrel protein [Winogradskyella jejuensis]SHG97847.1 Outer membrane protein beta-barrel domain-containing protein [Winogradskyella jejuensis]